MLNVLSGVSKQIYTEKPLIRTPSEKALEGASKCEIVKEIAYFQLIAKLKALSNYYQEAERNKRFFGFSKEEIRQRLTLNARWRILQFISLDELEF